MPITVITLGEPVRGTSLTIENSISSTFFATNLGLGDGVFKQITSGVAQFKSLIADTGIIITNNTNDLTIAVDEAYIQSLVDAGASGFTLNRVIISNGTDGSLLASSVTTTELGYLSGVSSNIQTQFSGKQDTITGAASSVVSANLSNNVAVVTNGSGKFISSPVTATEIGYLSGVTSLIQNQINALAASISGIVLNPLTADLVVPSPYKISLSSGAFLINQLGIFSTGGHGITLNSGAISTNTTVSAYDGFITGPSTGALKWKIVDIGSWNMDAVSPKQVAHGLSYTKILGVHVVIYDDAGTFTTNLDATEAGAGWIGGWDSTYITLQRKASGVFDNTSYDSTLVNRGKILILYIP